MRNLEIRVAVEAGTATIVSVDGRVDISVDKLATLETVDAVEEQIQRLLHPRASRDNERVAAALAFAREDAFGKPLPGEAEVIRSDATAKLNLTPPAISFVTPHVETWRGRFVVAEQEGVPVAIAHATFGTIREATDFTNERNKKRLSSETRWRIIDRSLVSPKLVKLDGSEMPAWADPLGDLNDEEAARNAVEDDPGATPPGDKASGERRDL